MYTKANNASRGSAARICIQRKEGWEINWESQIGPVLAVECIPQENQVLKDIFKIFIVAMLIMYLL